MWDSLLRALVPLLLTDGDIAKATWCEARTGETQGSWGCISVASTCLSGGRPWRATACWSKYRWEIFKREGRLAVGTSQYFPSCRVFGDTLDTSAALLGKQGMKG